VCWRDEVQKMQVQEANVAIDYRNARCKSYSDSRQCWRNTSVHGHVACLVGRARDRWMTRYDSRLSRRPARVYVCRVRMICAFCISAAVLRAVFSCIVTVYALWCSRRLNLTAEIATLPAHTCTQVHRPTQPKQADAYLGEIDVSRCI
jgi:hypothetical protein